MKFGKKSVGAVAAGLSLVMALSPVAAFGATAEYTVNNGVTKKLETNAGSTVSEQFAFTATPVQLNQNAANATATVATTEYGNATITTTALSAASDETETTATYGIVLPTLPHAGVYAWKVAETAGSTTGMVYDTETYTLIATVSNADDTHTTEWVSDVKLVKDGTTSTTNDASKKVTTATFTNTYTEKTNDGENKPLVVTKTVTGAQGDKTKLFDFTVNFTAPSNVPDGWTVKSITATAKPGTTVSNLTQNDDGSWTFKAADAGSVTFDNVVVGTTYKVTETESGQAGYTTTGEVKNDTVLAETGANVTVTNAKNDTVVTGLIVNNAPFIVMIGVAAAGVAAYGTAKRKLEK
ncbi:MAG: FctA domain-containing protein [Olegusella sp.]|nr:FctA domain-containing protein [Olegusella sp.]